MGKKLFSLLDDPIYTDTQPQEAFNSQIQTPSVDNASTQPIVPAPAVAQQQPTVAATTPSPVAPTAQQPAATNTPAITPQQEPVAATPENINLKNPLYLLAKEHLAKGNIPQAPSGVDGYSGGVTPRSITDMFGGYAGFRKATGIDPNTLYNKQGMQSFVKSMEAAHPGKFPVYSPDQNFGLEHYAALAELYPQQDKQKQVFEGVNSGKSFLEAFQESNADPRMKEEEARKQERANNSIKNLGFLADLGGLVGDFITAKAGGQVVPKPVVTSMVNSEILRLKKDYDAKVERYGAARAQAMMQDKIQQYKEGIDKWNINNTIQQQNRQQDQYQQSSDLNEDQLRIQQQNQEKQARMELKRLGLTEKQINASIENMRADNAIKLEALRYKKDPTRYSANGSVIVSDGTNDYSIPKNSWDSKANLIYHDIMLEYQKIQNIPANQLTTQQKALVDDIALMKQSFQGNNTAMAKAIAQQYAAQFPEIVKKHLGSAAPASSTKSIPGITPTDKKTVKGF